VLVEFRHLTSRTKHNVEAAPPARLRMLKMVLYLLRWPACYPAFCLGCAAENVAASVSEVEPEIGGAASAQPVCARRINVLRPRSELPFHLTRASDIRMEGGA